MKLGQKTPSWLTAAIRKQDAVMRKSCVTKGPRRVQIQLVLAGQRSAVLERPRPEDVTRNLSANKPWTRSNGNPVTLCKRRGSYAGNTVAIPRISAHAPHSVCLVSVTEGVPLTRVQFQGLSPHQFRFKTAAMDRHHGQWERSFVAPNYSAKQRSLRLSRDCLSTRCTRAHRQADTAIENPLRTV